MAITKKKKFKDTLRFIACGSVDDGKSTLLGRMLFEKNFIFSDQLDEIKIASKKFQIKNKVLDFSGNGNHGTSSGLADSDYDTTDSPTGV